MDDQLPATGASDDQSPERDADSLAVLLELVPLSAIFIFFGFVYNDETSSGWWLVVVPLMASGLGWLKIGRIGTGFAIGVVRAGALWGLTIAMVLLFVALLNCEGFEGDPECDGTGAAIGLLASLSLAGVVAFVMPIVSAIMVARASRIR
jgi:hypothetical protein